MVQQSILNRTKLINAFEKSSEYPLTTVVAAMGYGKSVAVREFLKSLPPSHCYLSFEGETTSPQYIWTMMTRQLRGYSEVLGEQFSSLGFPSNDAQFNKIMQLLDEYTFSNDVFVVIDDYHYCHSEVFDRFIERLVKSQIDGLHLILISRTMPDVGMTELLLKDMCYQVPSELFELDVDEIIAFFNCYGYDISNKLAEDVFNASEGWISAVYLMLQAYGRTGRIKTGLHIEKLIETAVMYRYRAEDISLLKALSILDTISPLQANYIMGNAMSALTLQELSEGNAFIRYDEETNVYRIHNIFRSHLQKQLDEHPIDLTKESLYKRAGEWCMLAGDILTGLTYLSTAKAYNLILEAFETEKLTKVIDNNQDFVIKLFEKIPDDCRFAHPIAYLNYIGFYVTNIDAVKGEAMLREMEFNLLGTDRITETLEDRVFGEIALIRAYMQFNDLRKMYESFKRAHMMMKGKSLVTNQNKIVTFGSPHFMFMYYREPSKFKWTRDWCEKVFAYYTEMANGCGRGLEDLISAEVAIETADFENAEKSAQKAIIKAESLGQVSIILCAKFVLARIALTRGKHTEAIEILEDLGGQVEVCNSPMLSSAYDLTMGYVGGIVENVTYFSDWLKKGDIKSCDILYQGISFAYIVYGKLLILKKEFIQLEVMCETMAEKLEVFNHQLGYLHLYIFEAIAKYNLGATRQAIVKLQKAIDIGREDNLIMAFSEYGKSIMPLLEACHHTGDEDEYIERIKHFAREYQVSAKKSQRENQKKPRLTPREMEVLGRIVSGKINREIARELYIAEVTVRKNITSIYRKLDVNGRAAAVKKAFELELI